jgi:hypothetical protein
MFRSTTRLRRDPPFSSKAAIPTHQELLGAQPRLTSFSPLVCALGPPPSGVWLVDVRRDRFSSSVAEAPVNPICPIRFNMFDREPATTSERRPR